MAVAIVGRAAAARGDPPAVDARSLIESQVYNALARRNFPQPLKFEGPVKFEVELATPDRATEHIGKPGVTIVNPRLIVSEAATFWQAWNQFWGH